MEEQLDDSAKFVDRFVHPMMRGLGARGLNPGCANIDVMKDWPDASECGNAIRRLQRAVAIPLRVEVIDPFKVNLAQIDPAKGDVRKLKLKDYLRD
jgi:hypothetical protein